jgi:hypothetical protein
MAWTTPKTFVANDTLTAAELNTHLRDNLNETEAALASQDGSYFVGAGVNKIAERSLVTARINTNESTTSTSYTDLTTIGPEVTVETGGAAIVFFETAGRNSSGSVNGMAICSVAVSGATTQAASNTWSIEISGVNADRPLHCSAFKLFDDLTPGENTFTMKYRVATGTGSFGYRYIGVMPL